MSLPCLNYGWAVLSGGSRTSVRRVSSLNNSKARTPTSLASAELTPRCAHRGWEGTSPRKDESLANPGPHLSFIRPGTGRSDPLPLPRRQDLTGGKLTREARPKHYTVTRSCV